MSFTIVPGQTTWSMKRDEEGYREYEIEHLVRGLSTDGPFRALNTPGLSLPGAVWSFDNDFDPWAWCRPTASVTPVLTNEPNRYFKVKQVFSSKPLFKCNDNPVEDPLLQPVKVSGSFVKEKEEATQNRFGFPINNSAHEQVRGPKVEFDRNRPSVKIEFNSALLNLALICQFLDGVNDSPLWGLDARCVKFSGCSWERKFFGLCEIYYSISYEFEVNFETFDRIILDEGTKVLNGQWNRQTGGWTLKSIAGADPDPTNPSHFIKSTDKNGNPCKIVLNGYGLPAEVPITVPGFTFPVGDYYVSMTDDNLGNSTYDDDFWQVIAGSQTPSQWRSNKRYVAGNLVTNDGLTYIANADVYGFEHEPSPAPGVEEAWTLLPSGLIGVADAYDPFTTYSKGMWVQDFTQTTVGTGTGATTGIGSIKVEKYPSVNLLLLGIPLTF